MKTIKNPLSVCYESVTDDDSEYKIREAFNLLFNKIKLEYQFEKASCLLFVEEDGDYRNYPLNDVEIDQSFLLTPVYNVTMINLN